MEQTVPPESWFEREDPVFEGMVREFEDFDEMLQGIASEVDTFLQGVRDLAQGLEELSEGVVGSLAKAGDRCVSSDSYKLRQATYQIIRKDAPHSAISRLERNTDFNIVKPLESHLENNEKLKKEVEKRRRRLEELRCASQQMELCAERELDREDPRYKLAEQEYEFSRRQFDETDRSIFEWLYTLELHKGDILDSCLQTLKYLQYEFFTASAHALSGALPRRMVFRPMPELSPECLEAELESDPEGPELEPALDEHVGFASRLLGRIVADEEAGDHTAPPAPVDILSLSSLLAQGFEDSLARRALRLHQNDTQAALDWLIEGSDALAEPGDADGSRNATARPRQRWLEKLRQRREERLRQQADDARDGLPSPIGLGLSALQDSRPSNSARR